MDRELGERDYGIDRLVEIFEADSPRGSLLLLQIKGTSNPITPGAPASLSFPVATLEYAELFVEPVLAVLCPVRHPVPTFAYLWLQEYIAVVLDAEHPGWRGQETVTIHFPARNWIPGRENHLRFIASHPARLYALGQLARIQHELRWVADSGRLEQEDGVARARGLLDEAIGEVDVLEANDPQGIGREIVERALRAVEVLDSDQEEAAASSVPPEIAGAGKEAVVEFARNRAIGQISQAAQEISSIVAIYNEPGIRRGLWVTGRSHTF